MNFTCTLDHAQTLVTKSSLNQAITQDTNRLYITDEHIYPCIEQVPEHILILPAGEQHKHWGSIERIVQAALAFGLGRDACFVGIGGGVICDMVAFAASIYMRGVDVELVPTSLLAMVDASLGGKTGTDFHEYKNIIGTFHPATRVYVCPEILKTLPEREYRNGLAEVIKHALLQGDDLITEVTQESAALLKRDPETLETVIFKSMRVKKEYIESDPEERRDIRAKLNFGHTFGHALETLSGLSTWSHGEGVAWGMARAIEAGVALGITDKRYALFVMDLLKEYGFEVDYRIPRQSLDAYMDIISHDKKKRKGAVRFVLQESLGNTILTELEPSLVRDIVSNSRKW